LRTGVIENRAIETCPLRARVDAVERRRKLLKLACLVGGLKLLAGDVKSVEHDTQVAP
jgi:hypothetical protein